MKNYFIGLHRNGDGSYSAILAFDNTGDWEVWRHDITVYDDEDYSELTHYIYEAYECSEGEQPEEEGWEWLDTPVCTKNTAKYFMEEYCFYYE